MKFIKLVFTFFHFLFAIGCVNEEDLFELENFENGAIPNMLQTSNDHGFISLVEGEEVVIEFNLSFISYLPKNKEPGTGREKRNIEFTDVHSLSLEAIYTNSLTGSTEHIIVNNYKTWPVKTTIEISDLFFLFSSLNTVDDLNLGDQFIFTTGITFKDGRIYPAFVENSKGILIPAYSNNYNGIESNPAINTSLSYVVQCPLTIPTDGTWIGETDGFWFYYSDTVSITKLSNCEYLLSDITSHFYEKFGFSENQPITFSDRCNELTIVDSSDCEFNITTDEANGFPVGRWNPETGTIVFPWYDADNKFGLVTTFRHYK